MSISGGVGSAVGGACAAVEAPVSVHSTFARAPIEAQGSQLSAGTGALWGQGRVL